MLDYKYIGLRIKAKRKSLKLTQQQLSKVSNISPAYISRIESGMQNVTLDTIEKVAESLKEDAVYLITGIKPEMDTRLKKIYSASTPEFLYLIDLALMELEQQGILNINIK